MILTNNIYIYIYIYRERESERGDEKNNGKGGEKEEKIVGCKEFKKWR